MTWSPAALAAALAAGIWTSAQAGVLALAGPVWWLGVAAAMAAGFSTRRGGWTLVAVALGGAALAAGERAEVDGAPLAGLADDRVIERLEGIVAGAPERNGDAWRFVLDVRHPAPGRVWVTSRGGPAVLPGDRLVVTGRLRTPRGYRVPGAFRFDRLVRARGATLTLGAHDVVVVEESARWTPWRAAARWQRRVSARLGGSDDAADAILQAMVVGDRGALARPIQERFRDAGVAHVLAVSGLHLAVVALLVFAVVRRLWAACPALVVRVEAARIAALAAAPAAIAYTMMTGARISTVRALIVVLIVLGGHLLGRRARVVDALGVAALAVLVHAPVSLWDPSFQLSFAATAVLALALGRREIDRGGPDGGIARRWVVRLWRRLGQMLAATAWATAATAPFTAAAFGTVSVTGLLANPIIVPLVELAVLPLGVAGAVLGEIWPAGGEALIAAARACAGVVDALVAQLAGLPGVLTVPPPSGLEMVCLLLALAAALARARGVLSTRHAAAAVGSALLVCAGSWLWAAELAPRLQDEVRVTFIDVGQGDAAVIEVPGPEVWLVDGGGLPFVPFSGALSAAEQRRLAESPGREAVARFLATRRIRRIDVAMVSHPHPDHYMGLAAIAREVPIAELWVAARPEGPPAGDEFEAVLAELRARGTKIVAPPLGEARVSGGASLDILAPRYLDDTATVDPVVEENDNSLVARLRFAGRTVLFAGDLEHEGETLLVERHGAGVVSDIVKVPHHGSRTSSTPALVAATRPAVAVISCGVANRFDFPADEVVHRWQAAGARVVRTDRTGTVTVVIEPDGRWTLSSHQPGW